MSKALIVVDVQPTFCEGGELGVPGGNAAGFFFIGTPSRPLEERPRPRLPDVVTRWPG